MDKDHFRRLSDFKKIQSGMGLIELNESNDLMKRCTVRNKIITILNSKILQNRNKIVTKFDDDTNNKNPFSTI